MADIEKKIIEAPELPNVVQGDGRYVMSQIRRYLKEIALQVNLANGYTADEIKPSPSGLAAPASFALQFDTEGGHFTWRHVTYLDKLLYYELRTDSRVGNMAGLLERTQETKSDKMPASPSGTVYLYAVLKDKTYSNASVLTYNKARPEAPQDIAMTRNDQGILITYTFVPLDCMGAHIYVDGAMYTTDDNLFLYKGDAEAVDKIEVAYYDPFGEGERGLLYTTIPSVSNFIVERNGASLDFQWDEVPVYGVEYVVKVANVPVWETGVEVFRTKLTKKKLEYPNTGDLYFMIKAADPHGVYSKEAAWYLLSTIADSSRNVIMTFDQYETRYSGNKLNLYYDEAAGGLRLTEGSFTGEYIAKGTLPQTYRARNWYEGQISSIENTNLRVMDLDFTLEDPKAALVTCLGGIIGDIDSVVLRAQIARYVGGGTTALFLARLNETLTDEDGHEPVISQHADVFDFARFDKGLVVEDLTRLAYTYTSKVTKFGFIFNVKMMQDFNRCVLAVLKGDDGWLEIGWRRGAFYMDGSDGTTMSLAVPVEAPDYLTFGISQDDTARHLYIKSMNTLPVSIRAGFTDNIYTASIDAPPIGVFTKVSFYKGA